MQICYEIRFLDYWHMGSGLSAGAKLDSAVVRDTDNIPYIPGKTIKGLLREMAEEIDATFTNQCFGVSSDNPTQSTCFFSNVELDVSVKKQITTNKLQDNLYDEIAATKIGQKDTKNEIEGIAVDNSLREIEVVIPLTLQGKIDNVTKEHKDNMIKALQMIKRMGLNRNRGLGRCEIINIKEVL